MHARTDKVAAAARRDADLVVAVPFVIDTEPVAHDQAHPAAAGTGALGPDHELRRHPPVAARDARVACAHATWADAGEHAHPGPVLAACRFDRVAPVEAVEDPGGPAGAVQDVLVPADPRCAREVDAAPAVLVGRPPAIDPHRRTADRESAREHGGRHRSGPAHAVHARPTGRPRLHPPSQGRRPTPDVAQAQRRGCLGIVERDAEAAADPPDRERSGAATNEAVASGVDGVEAQVAAALLARPVDYCQARAPEPSVAQEIQLKPSTRTAIHSSQPPPLGARVGAADVIGGDSGADDARRAERRTGVCRRRAGKQHEGRHGRPEPAHGCVVSPGASAQTCIARL